MTDKDEAPDPNYLWLVIAFGAFFGGVTGLNILLDPVPWSHAAYFRETFILGAVLGIVYTGMMGLAKPAGWFAIATTIAVCYCLPGFHSENVQIYFFIALYFNLYFSFWNRLTLLRLLGAFVLTAGLLGFGYLADPGSAEDRAGVVAALVCLPLTLILFNGLKRLLMSAYAQTSDGLSQD